MLALVTAALLVASFLRVQRTRPLFHVGAGFVAGGAIGNLIDRVRLGYVTDFVAIGPWPKFNIADSAITVGVLILVWSVSMTPDRQTLGE